MRKKVGNGRSLVHWRWLVAGLFSWVLVLAIPASGIAGEADVLFLEGYELTRIQDWDGALECFIRAREGGRVGDAALFIMGDAALRAGDPNLAAKWFEEAVDSYSSRSVVLALARAQVEARRPVDALVTLDRIALSGADAEFSYWRGRAFMALGRNSDARSEFQVALSDPVVRSDAVLLLGELALPDLDEVRRWVDSEDGGRRFRRRRADLLRRAGESDEAELELRRLVRSDPGDLSSICGLALLLRETGRPAEAWTVLAPARKSVDPGARLELGWTLLELGSHVDARSIARQVALTGRYGHRIGAADLLAEAGADAEAAEVLRELAGSYPTDIAPLLRWAAIESDRGRPEESRRLLERAHQLAPDRAEVRLRLGRCLLGLGHPATALQVVGIPDASDPEVLLRAKALFSIGRVEEALDEAQGVSGTSVDDLDVFVARLLEHLGRFDEAEARAQAVVENDPSNGDAYRFLSRMSRRRGDDAEALGWLQRGVVRLPNDRELRISLGEAWLRADEPDSASVHFQVLIRRDPVDWEARLGKARVEMDKGRPGDLERLVHGPEDHSRVLALRAAVFSAKGAPALARLTCDEALALDPTNAMAHRVRGVALQQEGAPPDSSLAEWFRCRELDPVDEEAAAHGAALLYQQGQVVASLDWLEEAVLVSPARLPERGWDTLARLSVDIALMEELRNRSRELLALREEPAEKRFIEMDREVESGGAWEGLAGVREADAEVERAEAMYRSGQSAPALRVLSRVLGIMPEHRDAHYLAGVISLDVRAYAAAAQHFLWVLDRTPDDVDARRNAARALHRDGDMDAAATVLEPQIVRGRASDLVFMARILSDRKEPGDREEALRLLDAAEQKGASDRVIRAGRSRLER